MGRHDRGRHDRRYSEFVGVSPQGELCVDGFPCSELAEHYGTPLFVLSERQIRANVRAFRRAFRARYQASDVLFATKANNNPAVRQVFSSEGAGGDAFGFGELLVTLLAGTDPRIVVLNGWDKQPPELELAVRAGAAVHLDAPEELARVIDVARRLDRPARVGLRTRLGLHGLDKVMSDWPAPGSSPAGESIGRNMRERDKFGISLDDIVPLCKEALGQPLIRLEGLHHHLGRELADASLFVHTVREQLDLGASLREECGWLAEYYDFGGGMAFGRREGHGPLGADRAVPSYDDYAEVIVEAFRTGLQSRRLGSPRLLVEPGRALASDIGVLVARVGLRKEVRETGQVWLAVDASQGHMPNIGTGAWYYHPVPVLEGGAETEVVNLADLQCWYGNLAFGARLPRLGAGELVAFLDTGAYCDTKSQNFNLTPRPATVLVGEGSVEIVAAREGLEDVMGRFRVPAHREQAHQAVSEMGWSLEAGRIRRTGGR